MKYHKTELEFLKHYTACLNEQMMGRDASKIHPFIGMFLKENTLANEPMKKVVTDMDIKNASADKNVDLFRAEGFIQGAKWCRKQLTPKT